MSQPVTDSFKTRRPLVVDGETYEIFSLQALEKITGSLAHLPFSLKVLLENLLRNEDGRFVKADDIRALASPTRDKKADREICFMPARVLMQDFTGVPAIVDLAAMRDAMKRLGASPSQINPLVPVDLVIDHSVQVDRFGSADAYAFNSEIEFTRNRERYEFLRWGQKAFRNFTVVPPETGIVHQVNLEYIAQCVMTRPVDKAMWAYPDTLVGTDSHTTMINGLGVLGWGVGGIEAEAAMLGQPSSMLIPEVIGFNLTGKLPEGATATDAVLTITEILRTKGVVGKFVEFFGAGLSSLNVSDRATIANMAPEYGATAGFFPIDRVVLEYLELTGRDKRRIKLVEAYMREQGLFRDDSTPVPTYSETILLDLDTIEPSLAGPRRPQDRVPLRSAKTAWQTALMPLLEKKSKVAGTTATLISPTATAKIGINGQDVNLHHGAVVIAAITSCTNTSNPSVMIGSGILAKKAVEHGLVSKPWVKTSLSPGSKVVIDYLQATGLMPYLEQLGFHLTGYGCMTCIGNSGPLPEAVSLGIRESDIVAAAVLSGNRNFEGRINAQVRANYLASPPLVVAYALTGTMDIDLMNDAIGTGKDGNPVYLKDIWPTPQEIQTAMAKVTREMYMNQYRNVYSGDAQWQSIAVRDSELYPWQEASTYIKNPPYFEGMDMTPRVPGDIVGARVLAVLGDSVTTDHISPAGNIPKDSPAGKYLMTNNVEPKDFNSYGARRGNHEVMMRGTFANIRLKNFLIPGMEGGWTVHLPERTQMSIFEASELYRSEGTPSIVIAGKEYGSGSSRDWAAKGPALLGVKAVIAESYERIHRSNLVGMGVLPLQFMPGENRLMLGLTGEEVYAIQGIQEGNGLVAKKTLTVIAKDVSGRERRFQVILRIDTPEEVEYYRAGGILPYVLRQLVQK